MDTFTLDSVHPVETTKAPLLQPELNNYMDFRQYLRDYYEFRREQTKHQLRPYNYQTFSASADIKSPNYLKMIIEGKRNLSEDMIGKFARAMALTKDQGEEFRRLVLFNQALDPADRNVHLKKLTEHRFQIQLKNGEIDKKTWDKIPNWVTWVIYAMIDQEGVKFDAKSLRELLRSKASEDEIQQALDNLLANGEIVRDETGFLKKARPLMESADEVPVALIRKLQMQLMYLGLESLYQDSAVEREFGTLTLSLTQTEFEDLKFKLRQMRKSIHKDTAIQRMGSKGDRVYQLNIQLFPVTAKSK